MAEYVHQQHTFVPGEFARVRAPSSIRFMFLTDLNYSKFRRGESFDYYGGNFTQGIIERAPPWSGLWHVVIDCNGRAGSVPAKIQFLKTP